MSEIKWTKQQLAAIEARGAKVLVNAAAGSGKTAVLTTRIINRLIPQNDEQPIRADRLLVVTFTKAAASEMRERIEKGLKKLLEETAVAGDMKKSRFIARQVKQLAGAKICTIDSFCQSLVKEYFHILDIDPAFRIAQKSEEKLLREEVFDKLSRELYSQKNEEFMVLVTKCTKSGREDAVRDIIEQVYDFTSNMPYQIEFLEKSSKDYLVNGGFYNSCWYDKICKEQKQVLKLMCEIINNGKEVSGYSFDDVQREVEEIKGTDNASVVGLLKQIDNINTELPVDTADTEGFLRELFYPEIKAVCDVTIKFIKALYDAKRAKSLLTFADIERMAYLLLAENSDVRKEQQERFDEILIDEYQDTNELQDGIFEMLSRDNNLFMVGDMKQSIYRFRGSDPLVFRGKADAYSYNEGAALRKITLSQNYRSRTEVLSSVNDLFESCMTRVVGELNYDEAEQLNLGNEGFSDTGFSYKSEFALLEIDSNDEEAPGRVNSEAEYIAGRIAEMKSSGFLVRDNEGVRPIKNSDIVILMSSHKTDGEVFTEVLKNHGIDAACVKEGYFKKTEVRLLLALLEAIDNPQRDISLVAVMRSFVGGFSDDEIARIRVNGRKISFYESLMDICAKYNILKERDELSPSGEIFGEKVIAFVGKIISWRDKARYMSAERLVNMLLEEAGFYTYFSAAEGNEAVGNLRLFFDKAKQFENSGYRGLFTFLRHMQRLADSGEDLEGNTSDTSGDYVRIMTIHKSKGLEFPVVFIAGAGKRFNRKDAEGKLLMHSELGISLDYTDYYDGVMVVSPVKGIFEYAIKGELLSEEMRKLYVALTRAKEKVIVTASLKKDSKTQDKLDAWKALGRCGMKSEAKNAKNFADWLAPVSMDSDNWEFSFVQGIEAKEEISIAKTIAEISYPDINQMKDILIYTYPYAAKALKSKAAVSDFKGISHIDIAQKPKFMAGRSISGADFGTAVHKIMETLPRDKGTDKAYIENHIKSLAANGEISSEMAETVKADKIISFYQSDLGKRFAKAKKVYVEREFEIGFDADELYGDEGLSGEKVLLQGIIDCYFEEEDGIVIVDYKTDRVNELDEIHQKYDIQLALYARALEKIAKKTVKEKFIYLFSEDCVVQC